MKKKIYVLVECEVETKRRSNFEEDIIAVELMTNPISKTKIISNDIIGIYKSKPHTIGIGRIK